MPAQEKVTDAPHLLFSPLKYLFLILSFLICGMIVSVNNQQQDLPEHATVLQALQSMQVQSFNGVAVAVNNTIVKKENWSTHSLQPNDSLVLIRASQGG
jgi:sulfur carrier protein